MTKASTRLLVFDVAFAGCNFFEDATPNRNTRFARVEF